MPRKLLDLVLSSHPGPGCAVTAVTVILGVGVGLEPWRVILLGVAMLLGQSSVGWSNDWLDAKRDRAVGRSDKPVAAGRISVTAVRAAAIASAVLAVVLTAPLGWPATLAHTVFIASAWAYNLGLKSTIASVLPYVVSFGILPLIVTLALTEPAMASPWAIAAGSLLGIAAHIANVLPDLEDDRATNVRGLPHRLGSRASALLIATSLVAASCSIVFGLHGASPIDYVGLALSTVIAVIAGLLVTTRPTSAAVFRLIIASALLTVILLALAGPRILA